VAAAAAVIRNPDTVRVDPTVTFPLTSSGALGLLVPIPTLEVTVSTNRVFTFAATFPAISRSCVGFVLPIPTCPVVISTKRFAVPTCKFEATSTSPEKAWKFVVAIYKYPTIFLAV
jgi:hypothetical protein